MIVLFKRFKNLFLVIFGFSFLGALVVFSLYFTNLFVLKEIKVYQNNRISKEEIIKLMGLKGGERLFSIDLKNLQAKLKAHPLIEDVIIARRLPYYLEITVREREGLAILIKENRGYLVDKRGVIIGGILPQDYLFYPLVEIKNDHFKEKFFLFLDWLKHNKTYLPVYENLSKITLMEDKIIFQTKNYLTIYFPLSLVENLIELYKHLDRIMVYLYDNNLIEKVELIRLDYPYGRALLKFRS
ncbi:MAG: cell division protein FtsQ/DivIB [Caldimicrobium sp.]